MKNYEKISPDSYRLDILVTKTTVSETVRGHNTSLENSVIISPTNSVHSYQTQIYSQERSVGKIYSTTKYHYNIVDINNIQ